ncbi:HAMP domain-containing histidine kinase [Sulfurimonas sp. MAG313]|nr:ArsS family sensor histidine kinase [Sulfurimonas sp. MAG313]MDF1880777.1 HAMP domain-containing histidine kinase [Sulfurimonas sp. MAG313]
MNPFKYSLISKIRFLGWILALLIIFILFLSYQATMFYARKEQVHHAIKVSNLLIKNETKLESYLIQNNIEKIKKQDALKQMLRAKRLVKDPLIRSVIKNSGIELFVCNKHIFFVITHENIQSYYRTNKSLVSTIILPLSLYAGLLFLLLYGIYFFIKNALSPLLRLNENIQKFSKGEDVEINYEQANDEIANVANAFYSAVEHNKKLRSQRDMYIRTIMHEIKTPLTKAKFITHFMKDEQEEKNKLDALFDSMQDELDKLHEFESVNTKILKIKLAPYSLNALVADVCDVLLLEDNEVEIDEVEVSLTFDYNLLIVALKNLIDNALKYSKDTKVKIIIRSDYLEIQNLSLQDKSLDVKTLFEPFKQEDTSSLGMGLGLYLINEILNKHQFTLLYRYVDKYHVFRLVF